MLDPKAGKDKGIVLGSLIAKPDILKGRGAGQDCVLVHIGVIIPDKAVGKGGTVDQKAEGDYNKESKGCYIVHI
jgi:hypothetical protein